MNTKPGKNIYNDIKTYLEESEQGFKDAESHLLVELEMYFSIFFDAKEYIEKNGYVDKNQNGIKFLNPQIKAADMSSKHIGRILTRIGLYDIMKKKLVGFGKFQQEQESRVK
jgi:phage terminase small subunit